MVAEKLGVVGFMNFLELMIVSGKMKIFTCDSVEITINAWATTRTPEFNFLVHYEISKQRRILHNIQLG